MPKRRRRKCKHCREWFEPDRENQVVCCPKCAYEYAKSDRAKRKRKEVREKKQKAKTTGVLRGEAQDAVNAYIRLRDAGLPCVSCGKTNEQVEASAVEQWHAGHFRPVGSHPELRYDESNIAKQCSQCNRHRGGMPVEYEEELIRRIGPEEVARLKGPQKPRQYNKAELREIIAHYKAKVKELRGQLDEKGSVEALR